MYRTSCMMRLSNVYYRYSGDVLFKSFASADDREEADMIPLTFTNVIVQRVEYEYAHNNKLAPIMQSVGKGNADIFIGGRYIPGYWISRVSGRPDHLLRTIKGTKSSCPAAKRLSHSCPRIAF